MHGMTLRHEEWQVLWCALLAHVKQCEENLARAKTKRDNRREAEDDRARDLRIAKVLQDIAYRGTYPNDHEELGARVPPFALDVGAVDSAIHDLLHALLVHEQALAGSAAAVDGVLEAIRAYQVQRAKGTTEADMPNDDKCPSAFLIHAGSKRCK
jgi:hypothetical protein